MRFSNKPLVTSDLETKSVGRLLLHYSIPTILGTVANALYNIVDRIFIGQGVGPYAISGLAITFPLMVILGAFGMLVGQGAAAQVSIHLGRKEHRTAEHILGNALTLTFVLYVALITVCLLFLDELLVVFGGTEATISYAKQYLQIIIPFNIFANISFGFNNIMRATGFPVKAMITMLIGAVLNTILDPIFIFLFGWGIQGAAYATALSMFVTSVWVMRHFFSKESIIRFRWWALRPNKDIILTITAIGLSPFLIQLSASLVGALINNTLLKYGGDLAIGAYGILNSFATLIIFAIIGLNNGMQPIVGYNFGAKQYKRVLSTLRIGLIFATALTAVGFLLAELLPQYISRMFTSDEELIRLSSQGLQIALAAFFLVGGQVVTTSFFQSIGSAKLAIMLSLTRQLLFLIPFILFFPQFFGLTGVWLSFPVADTISAVLAFIVLKRQVNKMHALQAEALR